MNSRSTTRRLRACVLGVALGVIATLAFSAAASAAPAGKLAAPAPSSPPAKPSKNSVSISGDNLGHTLTFRQDEQPSAYSRLMAEVAWMNGRSADVIKTTPVSLGPHYVVVTQVGSKVTGRYDLYPEVEGGPRAHRQALGSAPEAWFYAPIDMVSTLAAVGVSMPASGPDNQDFEKPTVAATSIKHSLADIARESVTALVLAGLGCVAILILLGFAARRSRSVDRRRTVPPAMGRLGKARASAGRPEAQLRAAAPPARRAAGPMAPVPSVARGQARPQPPVTRPARPAAPADASLPRQTGSTPAAGAAEQARAAAVKRAAEAKQAFARIVSEPTGSLYAVKRRLPWRALFASRGLPQPRTAAGEPAAGEPAQNTPVSAGTSTVPPASPSNVAPSNPGAIAPQTD